MLEAAEREDERHRRKRRLAGLQSAAEEERTKFVAADVVVGLVLSDCIDAAIQHRAHTIAGASENCSPYHFFSIALQTTVGAIASENNTSPTLFLLGLGAMPKARK